MSAGEGLFDVRHLQLPGVSFTWPVRIHLTEANPDRVWLRLAWMMLLDSFSSSPTSFANFNLEQL